MCEWEWEWVAQYTQYMHPCVVCYVLCEHFEKPEMIGEKERRPYYWYLCSGIGFGCFECYEDA